MTAGTEREERIMQPWNGEKGEGKGREGKGEEDATHGGDPALDGDDGDDDGHKIHSTRKVNLNKYRLASWHRNHRGSP